jgi:hypothetical protein
MAAAFTNAANRRKEETTDKKRKVNEREQKLKEKIQEKK